MRHQDRPFRCLVQALEPTPKINNGTGLKSDVFDTHRSSAAIANTVSGFDQADQWERYLALLDGDVVYPAWFTMPGEG